VPQKQRDGAIVERCGRDTAVEETVVGNTAIGFAVWERNQTRALVPAKRIGLRGPVQVAERPGKAAEMVLGGLVVLEGEQDSALFREYSQPFVELGYGLRELLFARGVGRGVHLTLCLGAREAQ